MRFLRFVGLAGFAAVITGCSSTNPGLPTSFLQPAQTSPMVNHNSWSMKKPLPHAVTGAGAVAISTKIYVVGGLDNTLAPYGGTQIYNISSNKWSTGASMPTPRWDIGAVAVN